MAEQAWYIAVLRAVHYADNTTGQEEVMRIGPFTANQLQPTLNKLIYRRNGAIRIFTSSWLYEKI